MLFRSYITDTDRCFLENKKHQINKKRCLETLFKVDNISLGKGSAIKNIPFNIIFMSENLENVLLLESKDFSDDEKKRIANKFSEDCENDFQKYIETFIRKEVKTWESYLESYDGIETCKEIASNMNNFLKEFNLF